MTFFVLFHNLSHGYKTDFIGTEQIDEILPSFSVSFQRQVMFLFIFFSQGSKYSEFFFQFSVVPHICINAFADNLCDTEVAIQEMSI